MLQSDFQTEIMESNTQVLKLKLHQYRVSSNTATRGRPLRNAGNVTSSKSATKDSTVRCEARAPAKAYAIRACEDVSLPDFITVSNPLGKYVLVDKVCKNYPLMTRGYCFLANLMLLSFNEFNVILGMNWLTPHDAVNSQILRIESDESSGLLVLISSMLAQKYVRKGYNAYLAYVLDTKVSKSVPVVCEYPDVFSEELPGTSPISIAPYRMAPTELKELKAHLQELTDRGFAQPIFLPWGAPVLFVNKKDG
ncbi:DNA/RNA polymerases superfamily protein [Gossypium australe]|uniref:DNA/RNA polymerases superfamily protein n=1 Tax=Gossypium australe TaxID=47621 RepID=A0A5B6WUW8_9ROSI|nr:DNA/RNA polymerases superfamily protein [Gossypium australe]